MTDSDEALLVALQGGELSAFRELYGRHKDAMLRIAIRILTNRSDAEDAVQDAFFSLFRRADRFQGRSAFTTWLYRIVVNACLKIRNERRGTETLSEGMEPAGVESSDPSGGIETRESARLVDRAILSLPLQQRIAFTLVAVEGVSRVEAAGIMGIDAGTVRYHLFAAREGLRKRLRPLLEGKEETDDAV